MNHQDAETARPRRWSRSGLSEATFLVALIVMAVGIMVAAWTYPRGSVIYPFSIGAALLVLAAARLVPLYRHRQPETPSAAEQDDESPREDLPWRSTAIYASSIVAMVVSLNFVWFPIAASVTGIAVLRLVFAQSWRSAIVGSLLVSGISSAVFWALGVPLPGGG
jgi:hypothetical protein